MQTGRNPAPGFARNPRKRITVEPFGGMVTVRRGATVIARSRDALALTEEPYATVLYVPFGDVDFDRLEKTATSTHCPYKGDASYWRVKGGERDVMWAYERPYDEMEAIGGHAAFYADRVDVETS